MVTKAWKSDCLKNKEREKCSINGPRMNRVRGAKRREKEKGEAKEKENEYEKETRKEN